MASAPDVEVRVFTTSPSNPSEGDTYVWAGARWYQRVENEWGVAAFTHVADDESDLREMLMEQDADLTELDDEYAAQVRSEFSEVIPMDLYEDDQSTAPPE